MAKGAPSTLHLHLLYSDKTGSGCADLAFKAIDVSPYYCVQVCRHSLFTCQEARQAHQ